MKKQDGTTKDVSVKQQHKAAKVAVHVLMSDPGKFLPKEFKESDRKSVIEKIKALSKNEISVLRNQIEGLISRKVETEIEKKALSDERITEEKITKVVVDDLESVTDEKKRVDDLTDIINAQELVDTLTEGLKNTVYLSERQLRNLATDPKKYCKKYADKYGIHVDKELPEEIQQFVNQSGEQNGGGVEAFISKMQLVAAHDKGFDVTKNTFKDNLLIFRDQAAVLLTEKAEKFWEEIKPVAESLLSVLVQIGKTVLIEIVKGNELDVSKLADEASKVVRTFAATAVEEGADAITSGLESLLNTNPSAAEGGEMGLIGNSTTEDIVSDTAAVP